jgi:hypothetical protein
MNLFDKVTFDCQNGFKQKKNVMQQTGTDQQQAVQDLYNLTANLILSEKKNTEQAKNALVERGLSEDAAYTIVRNVEDELKKAKKGQAGKDILYGTLWCVGGIIATVSNIGFIFWGAILFGGIQLIKGAVNYFND